MHKIYKGKRGCYSRLVPVHHLRKVILAELITDANQFIVDFTGNLDAYIENPIQPTCCVKLFSSAVHCKSLLEMDTFPSHLPPIPSIARQPSTPGEAGFTLVGKTKPLPTSTSTPVNNPTSTLSIKPTTTQTFETSLSNIPHKEPSSTFLTPMNS